MKTNRNVDDALTALFHSKPQKMATTRSIKALLEKEGFGREQILKALDNFLALRKIEKTGLGIWRMTEVSTAEF